ncbi:hypothetical protein PHMEG_00025541 [Phytophthora megakarya]|uniref:Uncharacterized protein n=1 Tax=Phytophthora megakarya TaxID=4795 RepID=A0A225VBD3_9STRA|nr:hypothetical protein PHMEG_00025541 [Phytophthora megakarya]
MSASLRTPVSSPVSASTSVSTPVVDSASTPTSASVRASAHVSAVTPTPLSGTTEKNFSVDKYFELQEKKLELEAKQRTGAAKPDRPRTVFDGSSIFSADGGIPVDYEDGELEDEGTSSSLSHESKPAAGTRRPREDDSDGSSSKRPRSASDAVPSRLEALAITSEQRDATRTDDTVREPWMPSKKVIDDRYGATVPPNEIPLYVDNRLVDDAEAAAKHFEPTKDYYISLFHEHGYWSSKKTSGRSRVPEWQALLPEGVHCPHCPTGAPRINERDLTGYTTNRVPVNIKELRAKLACTRHHPSVVPEHNTPRNTARRSSVVSFVRLHHFRNVRHQDVSGKPRISKESRSSPTNTKTNRTSVRPRTGMVNNRIHLAVDRTADRVMLLGGAGRSSYGQPQVGHGLQALHARVEALATLNLQKAYVAEAAQTNSNIRVEVLEQVRLLRERVKGLDEKLRTRHASSSASHHG